MVSVLSITGMFFALLVSVLLPIALLLFAKKKMSARLFPAAVGAAVFVIAALILERIVHAAIFTAFPVILKNKVKIISLYISRISILTRRGTTTPTRWQWRTTRSELWELI